MKDSKYFASGKIHLQYDTHSDPPPSRNPCLSGRVPEVASAKAQISRGSSRMTSDVGSGVNDGEARHLFGSDSGLP